MIWVSSYDQSRKFSRFIKTEFNLSTVYDPLPELKSAWMAEHNAQSRSWQKSGDKRASIYHNSRHILDVVHDFEMLSKKQAFLIATGIPIQNSK